MSNTCTAGATRPCMAAAFLGFMFLTACAPTVAQRQTPIMAKSGKVSVTAAALRSHVNDLVARSAGRIERTADRVGAEADDDATHRHALLLKIDAIPALYTAGFRADPLEAVLDIWGFAFQFSEYAGTGAGQSAFRSRQPLVQSCAGDMLADADAVIRAIAIRPEHFVAARAQMEAWAKNHPIEYPFSSRPSAAGLVVDLRTDDQDIFQTVGAVSDLVENLSERMNVYAAHLPKQARWQAEVFVTEVAGAHGVESALGDLRTLGTTAQRMNEFLVDVPGLVTEERQILAAERRAVLDGINDQRMQVLAYITAERRAALAGVHEEWLSLLAAVREERIATVAAIREERIATVAQVEALTNRAADSGLTRLREVIDYTLWRVSLLFGLMFAGATVVLFAYGALVNRRRQEPPRDPESWRVHGAAR